MSVITDHKKAIFISGGLIILMIALGAFFLLRNSSDAGRQSQRFSQMTMQIDPSIQVDIEGNPKDKKVTVSSVGEPVNGIGGKAVTDQDFGVTGVDDNGDGTADRVDVKTDLLIPEEAVIASMAPMSLPDAWTYAGSMVSPLVSPLKLAGYYKPNSGVAFVGYAAMSDWSTKFGKDHDEPLDQFWPTSDTFYMVHSSKKSAEQTVLDINSALEKMRNSTNEAERATGTAASNEMEIFRIGRIVTISSSDTKRASFFEGNRLVGNDRYLRSVYDKDPAQNGFLWIDPYEWFGTLTSFLNGNEIYSEVGVAENIQNYLQASLGFGPETIWITTPQDTALKWKGVYLGEGADALDQKEATRLLVPWRWVEGDPPPNYNLDIFSQPYEMINSIQFAKGLNSNTGAVATIELNRLYGGSHPYAPPHSMESMKIATNRTDRSVLIKFTENPDVVRAWK